MKNTKKIIALAMILAMAFMFVACGGSKTTATPTTQPTTQPTTTPTATPATTPATTPTPAPTDTAEKVLVMATNAYFPPYEFYDGEKVVGIDVEIAEAIAAKLGYTLKIQDIEFNSIITEVQAGNVDFGMAGMTVKPERLESVDFTNSYASGVQVVVVLENSEITSVDDIGAEGKNYKIGVQLGTTSDSYATDDYGKDNVVEYSNGNEAIQALIKGDVQCVLIDNEPAKALVNANAGTKILDTTYADEDYAICVKKGNTELVNKLNTAIYELTEDGTIESIVNKYIK